MGNLSPEAIDFHLNRLRKEAISRARGNTLIQSESPTPRPLGESFRREWRLSTSNGMGYIGMAIVVAGLGVAYFIGH